MCCHMDVGEYEDVIGFDNAGQPSIPGDEPVVHQQTRTVNGVNEYPSIDPDGPLTPTPEPVPPVPLTYDAAGNLTVNPLVCNPGDVCEPGMPCGMGSPICGSGQRYVYDQENRLTVVYGANSTPEVTTDDVLLAQYEYDALGRRVSSIEYVNAETGAPLTPPKRTRHVYVGIETIEEYDVEVATEWPYAETATLAREFLWGDPGSFPEPLAMVTQGGASGGQGGPGVPAGESVYHYLHDALGSVVGLTDSAGVLVERYTYDPYGRTLIEDQSAIPIPQSAFGNPWMWTGQRYDAGTGLYAFYFRTYSPTLGRWLQRDPIGYAGSVSLYQYVLGAPLTDTDPLGLVPKFCEGLLAEIQGLADSLNRDCRSMPPSDPGGQGLSCKKDPTGNYRTKPGGHRVKCVYKQNRLRRLIEKYDKRCGGGPPIPQKSRDVSLMPIPDPNRAPDPQKQPLPNQDPGGSTVKIVAIGVGGGTVAYVIYRGIRLIVGTVLFPPSLPANVAIP